MGEKLPETRTKQYVLPLRVHSRVRVIAVTVWLRDTQGQIHSLLNCLNATGTVVSFDPRRTLPWRVKLDSGEYVSFAEDNLEVLEP